MNQYETGAQFLLNYGLAISIGIICFVLVIALITTYLWIQCLKDVLLKDEEIFPHKTIWIWALTIPAIGILFWGSGFILMFFVSLVYIILYKPRLR